MKIIRDIVKRYLPYSMLVYAYTLRTKMRWIDAIIKLKLGVPLKRKRDKLKFQVHLVEHCNLNCRGCDNFSPIATPEFLTVEDFRRDIERLADLFSHECEQIQLLGGEPLLHPQITSFVKIARENFPKGTLAIVTNGILLSQKDEDFWRICHDNKTEIIVTRYPINIDEDKIKSLADKFDVAFQWYGQAIGGGGIEN